MRFSLYTFDTDDDLTNVMLSPSGIWELLLHFLFRKFSSDFTVRTTNVTCDEQSSCSNVAFFVDDRGVDVGWQAATFDRPRYTRPSKSSSQASTLD